MFTGKSGTVEAGGPIWQGLRVRADSRISFVLVVFLALAVPAVAAAGATDPMKAKWCHRCHGVDGHTNNARVPNLAAQKARYLAQQLVHFREGSSLQGGTELDEAPAYRVHRSMLFNAKRLTNKDIAELALYFAGKPCGDRTGADAAPPPLPAAAQPCLKCHNANGVSTDPRVPNPAGQNRTYLLNQLDSF